MTDIAALARIIDDGQRHVREIAQFEASTPVSLADAYAIQSAATKLRLARGEQRSGVKMGFTSRAKMIQMGIADVIWGRLTDAMRIDDGGTLSLGNFIHPRVEPEVAFLIGRDIDDGASVSEIFSAIEAVAPAMEIIDSRYERFKFTLNEVIADNASAARYVIGPWRAPHLDVANLGIVMSFNGQPVQIGSTAAILGNPLRAFIAGQRLSAAAGEPLRAGWIVMAGGASPAEWLKAGTYVRLEMEALGSLGFHVVP